MGDAKTGVLFPLTEKGDRSTTSFTKDVFRIVADGLGCATLATAIKSEKDWRHKYDVHMEAAVEGLAVAGMLDQAAAARVMTAALDHARGMDFESGGKTTKLADAMANRSAFSPEFSTAVVTGQKRLPAKTEITIPYHGEELSGAKLDTQCDHWAKVGTMEPSTAAAIKAGAKKLGQLQGRTFLVLGASSELGAVRPLLEAGATVCAVMRKNQKRWAELVAFARETSGSLLAPVSGAASSDEEIAAGGGADLLADAPRVASWLLRCGKEAPGPVTLCTYLYADGEANVRLTAAADFIAELLAKELGKQKVSFAYLVSGSTSHLISKEAVAAQDANYETANWWSRTFGTRVDHAPSSTGTELWNELQKKHAASGRPQQPDYHFFRGLTVLQGPNYAVAQYMRQWRAMLLHMEGFTVSTPVTPNCRTESVVHNPTMAVVLEGMAYWKPMESFDADTCRLAMLAILVTDLAEPPAKTQSAAEIFGLKAFHSGLWRCPFQLSSLGTATWVMGKVAPRPKPIGFDV